MKFSNFFDKKICDYLIKQDHIVDLLQIQELCIPKILKHENTIVVSSTGSGKTLCFVLPTLVNLNNEINEPQVLVLLPTNELSKQILSVYKHYATLFHNVTFYNAFNKHKSTKNINSKIILSSPSEAIRLIKEGQLNINHLETVILDEADMLYEFFHKEWKQLLIYLKQKKNLQYCLFSATLHESLSNSIKKDINNAIIIKDKNDIWTNKNIKHYLIETNILNNSQELKLKLLDKLLQMINPFFCLIFVNNKKDAILVNEYLIKLRYKSVSLYSELDHKTRRDILLKANKLQYQILVCTDLAARGIDLNGVSDVISYDLPIDDLYYIHRAGRTGRGKYEGNSYVFNLSNNTNKIKKLKEKLDFKKIKLEI